MGFDPVVNVESSMTIPLKDELVDNCTLYVDAPINVDQFNVGVNETFVAVSDGELRVGVDGTGKLAAVVKNHTFPCVDNLPSDATTFQ